MPISFLLYPQVKCTTIKKDMFPFESSFRNMSFLLHGKWNPAKDSLSSVLHLLNDVCSLIQPWRLYVLYHALIHAVCNLWINRKLG